MPGRIALGLGILLAVGAAGQTRRATAALPSASEYEAYALRYATSPGAAVSTFVKGADPSRKIDIPFMFWVLKGASGRNVLVDAGSYHGPTFERWKLLDYVNPAAAIGKVGLSPADVTDVIITHIHWDHVNGADLFPAARVWIQREEFMHYVTEQGTPRDSAISAEDASMLAKLKTSGRLVLVEGDGREIIPGITVYTGGKHTYASQYVGVRSAAGTVILASDSIYLYENLEKHQPLGLTLDEEADLSMQERVLHLASSPRFVVPGHDPAVFERFPTPGGGVALIR
jgi:glyoxylase-like metal-dependent hydrolase (beta-lactamase superfamily II)